MAISSLASLITKYGSNFGITPQILAEAKAKAEADAKAADAGGKGGPTAGAANAVGSSETEGTAAIAKKDSVKLSPEALQYQKDHTSPTGKFMLPNLFGDMLDSFDNSSDGSAQAGISSLMDFLGSGSNGDPASSVSASADDPTGYFNNLGRLLGNGGPKLPPAKT